MDKIKKRGLALVLMLVLSVGLLGEGLAASAAEVTTLYTGGGMVTATGWHAGANGVTTGDGELPAPTMTGAIFGGWYTDAALTQGPIAAGTAAGVGPYYARWSRKTDMGLGATMATLITNNGATAWGLSGGQYTSAFFGNMGFLTFWTDRALAAGGSSTDVYGGTPINTFPMIGDTDMFVETKADVFVAAVPTIEGSFVRMNYYVQNRGGMPVSGFTLGVAGDAQLGNNDFVPLTQGSDSGYDFLTMVDKTAGTELRLLTSGKSIITPDRIWWGGYQPRDNQNGKGFAKNVLNDGKDSKYKDGIDSAFALSWTNITLQPGETRHYSVPFGVGRVGELSTAGFGNAITYDAQGGTGAPTDSDRYMLGDVVAVKNGTPERANYHFEGWSTNRYGAGALLQVGDTFSAQGDITLYAQWKPHTQAVTVNIMEVNTPITGLSVVLRGTDASRKYYPLTAMDAPGQYASNDIPKVQGSYDVLINFYQTPFRLSVVEGAGEDGTNVTFRYGHVAVDLTLNGAPITGKYVTLNQRGAVVYTLPMTDGRYQLSRIIQGTYDLNIDGKFHGALEVTGDAPAVKSIAATEYKITLTKDGLPWADASVSLVGEDNVRIPISLTGGAYTAQLPSGSYKLLVNGAETQTTLTAEVFTKQLDFFTVGFYNGETPYTHETHQRAQLVLSGQLATLPPAPASGTEVFTGWKTVDGGADAFDFSSPIAATTKIYASWNTPRVVPGPIIKDTDGSAYTLSDPKIIGYPADHKVASVTVEVDSGRVALKHAVASGDTAIGSGTTKLVVVFGAKKTIAEAEFFLKEQLVFTTDTTPQQVTFTVLAKS